MLQIASNLKDSASPASNNVVFAGDGGSFTPLYPAGKVYWILPGVSKKESSDKTQEADWWKKLQDWGKGALAKTKTAVNISRDNNVGDAFNKAMSNLDDAENCSTVIGKSMMRDAEWIEQWIKQQLQEVQTIAPNPSRLKY